MEFSSVGCLIWSTSLEAPVPLTLNSKASPDRSGREPPAATGVSANPTWTMPGFPSSVLPGGSRSIFGQGIETLAADRLTGSEHGSSVGLDDVEGSERHRCDL